MKKFQLADILFHNTVYFNEKIYKKYVGYLDMYVRTYTYRYVENTWNSNKSRVSKSILKVLPNIRHLL